MGKPKILKKKSSLTQSKISNYFKKQSEPDNNGLPLSSSVSTAILTQSKKTKQESAYIPLIILDDSTSNSPKAGLNDSSLDIIEATPESDKKTLIYYDKVKSPDIIPPTPVFEGKKSRVCLDRKFFSDNSKSVLNSCSNQDVFGVKRRAAGTTGMSPAAKKIDQTDEETKIKASLIKKDIFKNMSSPIKQTYDEDDSQIILEPFKQPIKTPHDGTKTPPRNVKSMMVNLNSDTTKNETDSDTGDKVNEFILKDDKNIINCKAKDLQMTDAMEIDKNRNSQNLKDNFEDDDEIFKNLIENIDQMSPFKSTTVHDELKWESICEKNLIGPHSFAASGNYNRHLVTLVDKKSKSNILILSLKSLTDGCDSICNLSGFWYDSYVKEGDIVNILLLEKVDNTYNVTDTQGILVINPDVLISGTSVVAGVFCRRKAILNEKFKNIEGGNKAMLIGSLVHELFQEIISTKVVKMLDFEDLVKKLVFRRASLIAIYGLNITETDIVREISEFLPVIEKWRRIYIGGEQQREQDEWRGSICDVLDIEENVWSPKYGIKGKIDLTVSTTYNGISKVMPLELKTGKPSYSAEHKGQVTLYSMMSSDRRDDSKAGLLLYLKNLSMKEIPAGEKEKSGLMQLRNELVSYLYQRLAEKEKPTLPRLPIPLNEARICQKCPQLLTCSTLLTVQNEVPEDQHSMSKIAPNTVAHLSQAHLDYFRHWCILLHLETWKEMGNFRNRALWCKDATEREEMGECMAMLKLSEDIPVKNCGLSQYMHTFVRNAPYEDMPRNCFLPGDSVIISSESEIALGIGVVSNVAENLIEVGLDRNLQKYPLWRSKVFRVDPCEFQATMGIIYANLVSLLKEESHFEHLRQLIIDRQMPRFHPGFDKSKIPLMKPILKNMNKNQQRAVLRVLLAEDYLIIKGFPGTGKTSTVVCLVRLLVLFGFSVLLTSYTHSAVDTILLKLKEHEDSPFLRIGKLSRINPELHQYSEDELLKNLTTVDEIANAINSKSVVATTCLGMNHAVFKRRSFDYCIIDEAAQVLQPAALGPLFHCKKFVLVGDSLQLPPVIKNQAAKTQGMSETLLERLDCETGTICLTQQYRMNKEIQRIANQLTYNDQLECANESVSEATLTSDSDAGDVCYLRRATSSAIEDSVIFIDTSGYFTEGRDRLNHPVNMGEVDIIGGIFGTLLEHGIACEDIGIITPYRGQVNLMKDSFAVAEINTVDQFQGKDKLVILYSCVKSGSFSEVKDNEILNDERRLNVAITRAKCKLVFVGDRTSLSLYSPFKKLFSILNENQFVSFDEK